MIILLLYAFKSPDQTPAQGKLGSDIRIKSGEPGFLGFSVPEWLGGVICKPEGAA